MRNKQLFFILASLFLLIAGCTSHKRPLNGAQVVGPHSMEGANGAETYTEGAGSESSYCESSKCRPGGPVAHAEQHYFFDFDSSDVRQDAMESIERQANYLLKHPNSKIRLEGNTDDVGSREYNVALGERRARSVLEVLKQHGVFSQQIAVISFGAEKPAAGGDDEKSRQCNRRVDLIYCD